MSNNPNLDDELAEFTDRLFSGDAGEVSADNMIEARLVRQLHGMMKNNSQPSPAFRARLTHRINDEWTAVQRQQPRQIIARPFTFHPMVAMAAVIVTALAFVILLMNPQSTGSPGTAGGGSIVVPMIFIGAVVIVGAIALWIRRR
jgi:hypothetical protein